MEFRAKPFGLHSPELHAILTAMRRLPINGKHILYATKPHKEWRLAVMEGTPVRPRLLPGPSFTDRGSAEWEVFKIRWQQMTGTSLNVD